MNTQLKDKEAVLAKTHYGLNIYARVLQDFYPGETVLSLSGRDCKPTKNPFNNNKPTLLIKIVNNVAVHTDTEDAIPPGDVFDFASRHYGLINGSLLEHITNEFGIRVKANIPPIIKNHYMDTTVTIPATKPVHVPSFSYFEAPVTNTVPADTATIVEMYWLIKSDEFKERTLHLQSITDKVAARKYKAANFQYATFSGIFSQRNDKSIIRHSGLIAIDFDHMPDLQLLKKQLLDDEYFDTELLFTSPSGDGLKWIIPIDITEVPHSDYFRAVAAYIKKSYNIEVDGSGKDQSRACFIPFDPDVFINPKYLL